MKKLAALIEIYLLKSAGINEYDDWTKELIKLNLFEDAQLVELLLKNYGSKAGFMDPSEAYSIARENKISTECVSKVLTFLRRKDRESGITPVASDILEQKIKNIHNDLKKIKALQKSELTNSQKEMLKNEHSKLSKKLKSYLNDYPYLIKELK